MTKHLGRLLIAGAFALSTSAFASIINFDFTGGNGSLVDSKTFTSGGVSATATAWSRDTNGDYVQGQLWLAGSGLGVDNAGNDNSQTVDNGPAVTGYDDYVRFLFSPLVTVTRISVWPYGDIDISYNTGSDPSQGWISQLATVYGNPTVIVVDVKKPPSTSVWAPGATSRTTHSRLPVCRSKRARGRYRNPARSPCWARV